MEITELQISHSFVITPTVHTDERGDFWENYRFDKIEEKIGHPFKLRQANTSISQRGVFRGIHFANLTPGQAKYVSCVSGEILDVVVDVRLGSPTFGKVELINLSDSNRKSLYLSEGLGHGFVALSDSAVVNYLVSGVYDPLSEHSINPLDFNIDISQYGDFQYVISEKDSKSPGISEALERGILPTWDQALKRYEELRSEKEPS